MLVTTHISRSTPQIAKQWPQTLRPWRVRSPHLPMRPAINNCVRTTATSTPPEWLGKEIMGLYTFDKPNRYYVGHRLSNDPHGNPDESAVVTAPDISAVYYASPVEKKLQFIVFRDETYQRHLRLQHLLSECPFLHTFVESFPSMKALLFHRPTMNYPNILGCIISRTSECADEPWPGAKRVLKDVLRGIVFMHQNDIIHTAIRPMNVYIDYGPETQVLCYEPHLMRQVQLSGLLEAIELPHWPSKPEVVGKAPSVDPYQSPEAIVGGPIGKPSDMFSFGVLCLFTNYQEVVFAEGGILDTDQPISRQMIAKHMNYLADEEQFYAFLHHIGKNPWAQELVDLLEAGVIRDHPNYFVDGWGDMEGPFKDLVKKLLAFDPARRLTAEEALDHPWFADEVGEQTMSMKDEAIGEAMQHSWFEERRCHTRKAMS